MSINVADAVNKFVEVRGIYDSFRIKIEGLLIDLVNSDGVSFHLIESRTKSADSFKKKLENPSKSYDDPIADMPDICGCRIITYYHDDVQKIGRLVKSQFDVVEEELSHQQTAIDADRFGYLSAHYVVKLGGARGGLLEWSSYSHLHCEIQIRTVVQHAWSAVSHALQYKSETRIPSMLQRRLYRIAGLFELADEEFVGIRNQKSALDDAGRKLVKSREGVIPLSSSTIKAFADEWFLREVSGKDLDELFVDKGGDESNNYEEYVADIYGLAIKSGVLSINELEQRIDFDVIEYLNLIMKNYRDLHGDAATSWGLSPSFCLLLVSMKAFSDIVDDAYLEENDWGGNRDRAILKAIGK